MARPTLSPEDSRSVKFAGYRFTTAEMIFIHHEITASKLKPSDWVRSTLLKACRPVATALLPPPTPTKPTADAKPAPTTTPPRKSSGVNMGNLGNFYGS